MPEWDLFSSFAVSPSLHPLIAEPRQLISIKCVSVGQRELTCNAHMLQSFNLHSSVERARCTVSTRGSRPMRKWERVKKSGGCGGRSGGEMLSESVTQRGRKRKERERERSLMHTNKQEGHTKGEQGGKKKMVTFLKHLKTCWLFSDACCLLMSVGVFKLLLLWSCFHGDCTWQAAERVGTTVIQRTPFYTEIRLTSHCADRESSFPVRLFTSREHRDQLETWSELLLNSFFITFVISSSSFGLAGFSQEPQCPVHAAFGLSFGIHSTCPGSSWLFHPYQQNSSVTRSGSQFSSKRLL